MLHALKSSRRIRSFCHCATARAQEVVERTDCTGDVHEFVALLQSVYDLSRGKDVHERIVSSGLEKHLFVGNCLINMYCKCGSLEDAQAVFDKMAQRNVVSWTATISANAQYGYYKKAFSLFRRMQLEADCVPNSYTFVALLNACEGLEHVKLVHGLVSETGPAVQNDPVVGNALINLYSKCGDREGATEVFDGMPRKDVVSWTAILGAYVNSEADAIYTFQHMLLQGVSPNKVTYVTVLGACSSQACLPSGKLIHSLVLEAGFSSDTVVANALVNMYGKCGSLEYAFDVFHGMDFKDLVSWNTIISACMEREEHPRAILLFRSLGLEGLMPNSVTYITVLNAFASCGTLSAAKDIHKRIRESSCRNDLVVMNAVINMYAKIGSSGDAFNMFKRVRKYGDLITWNAMLGAYNKSCTSSVGFFHRMLLHGLRPNKVTYITALNSCSNCTELDTGRKLHRFISRNYNGRDVSLAITLMNIYNKCGSLWEAQLVFDSMQSRNLVCWNAMLGTYAQHECSEEACQLFHEMLQEGEAPDCLSFTTLLSICSSASEAKFLQACISECGYRSPRMETATISMHGRCHRPEEAQRLFESLSDRADVVSWTTIISVCSEHGNSEEAHRLFRRMQLHGVAPDKFTLATVLDSCTEPRSLPLGKLIHACLGEIGFETDEAFENALFNMYVNCGDMNRARSLFHNMRSKDIISWNAMSAAYAQSGLNTEALLLFRHMQAEGVKPDKLTFATTLNVCAAQVLLSEGKHVQQLASESGLASDVSVTTGLVKMLSRCGKLQEARAAFREFSSQWSVALVNALLGALSQHGHCKDAVRLFGKMQQEGLRPDVLSLISMISACSHAGLVETGCHFFSKMTEYYGVSPTVDHYACLVDLVGRAGQLDRAEQLIVKMPLERNTLVWMSLLATCKLHGDAARGKRAAETILETDPQNSAAHVVLSSIYCSTGKWKLELDKARDNAKVVNLDERRTCTR